MKSYKSFLNEERSVSESVNKGIDHIDFGDFDDYVDDVDGFDKKDARKTFKETDPGAFNYVDTDWGDEFFEVEDYLKNNKIPFMYVNSMGESGIIWLAESVNEGKVSKTFKISDWEDFETGYEDARKKAFKKAGLKDSDYVYVEDENSIHDDDNTKKVYSDSEVAFYTADSDEYGKIIYYQDASGYDNTTWYFIPKK